MIIFKVYFHLVCICVHGFTFNICNRDDQGNLNRLKFIFKKNKTRYLTSSMTSRKNKRPGSAVWEYFDVPHDQDEIAACNLCGDILKRGIPGKKVSYSTKSLWGHLKSKHSNEFTSAEERQAIDKTQQEKKRKEEQARSQQYFLPNFELSSSSRDRPQITDLQTPTTSRVNDKSHGHHQTSLNSLSDAVELDGGHR